MASSSRLRRLGGKQGRAGWWKPKPRPKIHESGHDLGHRWPSTGVKKASPQKTPIKSLKRGSRGLKKARRRVENDYFASFGGFLGSFSALFRLFSGVFDPRGPRGPESPFSDFFFGVFFSDFFRSFLPRESFRVIFNLSGYFHLARLFLETLQKYPLKQARNCHF